MKLTTKFTELVKEKNITEIRSYLKKNLSYNLNASLEHILKENGFDFFYDCFFKWPEVFTHSYSSDACIDKAFDYCMENFID